MHKLMLMIHNLCNINAKVVVYGVFCTLLRS